MACVCWRLRPNRIPRLKWMVLTGFLLSIYAPAQEASKLAGLHGMLRDNDGQPAAQATILLDKKDSSDTSTTHTDAQGSYIFTNLSSGVYTIRATKDGYVDAKVSSVFLRAGETKTVDLTLARGAPVSATSAPQFFDQPEFTVAGVTDTTALGGHGSDNVVRARDSLAKDTASLGESTVKAPPDAAREKSLRELAERKPRDFVANHQLGELLVAAGRAREAIPFLERAAAQDPANYENAFDLSLANMQAGNYAVAKEEATKLAPTHDQPDIHHLLGDIDERLGDSLDAVRHYQRAAELDPSEPHLFDWGAELLLHHAPEPAEEVFSKGSRLFPASARMLLGLGAASFARGNTADAIRSICQASDLNPGDSFPYLFLGKLELAESVLPDRLVQTLHRSQIALPSADANFYYAVALWKQAKVTGDKVSIRRVESLLEYAVIVDPKHAQAWLHLGIVHSDQADYPRAIADYQKALEADPKLEEAHYRLAQAYRQIGESGKAKEELRIHALLSKESAQRQERERHEIKQFVYTLRDHPAPH